MPHRTACYFNAPGRIPFDIKAPELTPDHIIQTGMGFWKSGCGEDALYANTRETQSTTSVAPTISAC